MVPNEEEVPDKIGVKGPLFDLAPVATTYVPLNLTMRLAIHGFNAEGVCRWRRGGTITSTYHGSVNHTQLIYGKYDYEDDRWNDENFIDRVRKAFDRNRGIKQWYTYFIVANYDQVKNWFTETYGIDFVEMPSIGMEKLYICDPVGADLGSVKLARCKTRIEAMQKCFEYLLTHTKPYRLDVPLNTNELERKKARERNTQR